MTLCYICEKGELETKEVPYHYGEFHVGDYEAEVCPDCGEVFFTEAAGDAMDARVKELGLWGLEADAKLGRSGHSLMVRLPKALADFVGAEAGQKVHLAPLGPRKISVEVVEGGG